jgi:SET domain-containing protein
MAQSMECPINCNNSGNCLNQPVKNLRQKNSIKEKPRFSVKLSESNEKGYGLFSNVQLEKNEAFLEYIGEVEKKKNNTSDVNRMYIADLTSSFEVNAANYGNEARFINHSCTPNAKMIKWTVS